MRTRLEERSDLRLQEIYEEAEVGGVKIPIPERIQVRARRLRSLCIYLRPGAFRPGSSQDRVA